VSAAGKTLESILEFTPKNLLKIYRICFRIRKNEIITSTTPKSLHVPLSILTTHRVPVPFRSLLCILKLEYCGPITLVTQFMVFSINQASKFLDWNNNTFSTTHTKSDPTLLTVNQTNKWNSANQI
jgi:hypothetical protein